MILSNAALKNRITVLVLVVIVVIAGVMAYVTLPRESAPDVPIPIVLISTVYEGASPEDVETTVTMEIEQELSGLKGVEEITSTSKEGFSLIRVEFTPDVLIDDALQRVRDKVDLARGELPTEAEEPTIGEINVAEFPIMYINVAGPISPVRLKVIAEELEDYIERVPGVLEAEVSGALEREIRIEFDPDRLAAYRIGLPELVSLVPNENVNVSAGGMESGATKFNIRVPAEFTEPADVDHLLLTVRDGKPIYLADVATVRDTFKDRETISRLDGEPAITIGVKKRVGANILDIADQVKTILAQARLQAPAGVEIEITMDRSDDINEMVAELENNILTALILVLCVLMLFLGFRTALVVAAVIPLSMLMSFAILQAMGITLNMIVLFSLILALGMLVDNAIVIVENIYRYMQLGHSRVQAAMKGTAEVAWPVITSTATTIAAFAPLLLWEGIMGDFMKYLPITVITVLSSSLFVALVISPVLASLFIRAHGTSGAGEHHNIFQRLYTRVLTAVLGTPLSRIATLVVAVLLLVGLLMVFQRYSAGVLFFPDIDPERGTVSVRAPQGTNIYYTDQLAQVVESRLAPYLQRGEMKHVITTVGAGGGDGGFGGGNAGPQEARLTMVFPDFANRLRPSNVILAELRGLLSDLPGVEVEVSEEQHGPPTGSAVTLEFAGEDFATLATISEQAKNMIAGTPGMVNLSSDYEASRPELQFRVDRRRAMLLNVNTNVVGQFLKTAMFGRKVGTYRQFNDEYDITVRLPIDQRQNVEDLFRLQVPSETGDPVPLSSLGEFVYAGGFGDIHRIDQKRVVTLTADAEGRKPEEVLADVTRILQPTPAQQAQNAALTGLTLPEGYTLTYDGEKEEQDKATAFLGRAYLIAMLLILMILVAQFNTVSVPLVIMTTVGMSLIGVLVGLLVMEMPFVIIMTGIGVVSLAGVVVNNAIVLLDYTRQLQRGGMGLVEAAVEAGRTRLRPVVLTAVTTMLSLTPMVTGFMYDFHAMKWITGPSEAVEWWSPMASALVFGLGFATLLTLVFVPTLYVSVYSLLRAIGQWMGWQYLGGLHHAGENLDAEGNPVPTGPTTGTA